MQDGFYQFRYLCPENKIFILRKGVFSGINLKSIFKYFYKDKKLFVSVSEFMLTIFRFVVQILQLFGDLCESLGVLCG